MYFSETNQIRVLVLLISHSFPSPALTSNCYLIFPFSLHLRTDSEFNLIHLLLLFWPTTLLLGKHKTRELEQPVNQ